MDSVKRNSIIILVFAQIAGMGLWFTSAAILSDIVLEAQQMGVVLSSSYQALMSAMVQAGFVAGAITSALLGIADRYDPRRVFMLSALIACLANASLLLYDIGSFSAVSARFITGFALAGVYPVGLKIAAGWGQKDRGLLVGLLVGALTIGSALPHLFAFLGGTDWRTTVLVSSGIAALGGTLIVFSGIGPYHAKANKFNWRSISVIWQNPKIRAPFLGYLGHMWELYAMWAWIGAALAASMSLAATVDANLIKLSVFIIVGAGGLACVFGGMLADKIGKVQVTIIAMALSAFGAMATGLSLNGPYWITLVCALVWGIAIIPDSPQFSAIIADYSPKEITGSLLSLQTALGFLLTVFTVQLTPIIANNIGWSATLCLLAIGPLFGIWAMLPMLKRNQ